MINNTTCPVWPCHKLSHFHSQLRQNHSQSHGGPPVEVPGSARGSGGGFERRSGGSSAARQREAVHHLHQHSGGTVHCESERSQAALSCLVLILSCVSDTERLADAGAGQPEVLEALQAPGALLRFYRPEPDASAATDGRNRREPRQISGSLKDSVRLY